MPVGIWRAETRSYTRTARPRGLARPVAELSPNGSRRRRYAAPLACPSLGSALGRPPGTGAPLGSSRKSISLRTNVSLGEVTTPLPAKRRCVFCGEAGKITLEHILPSWMTSGEDASRHLYIRESGGPDYEPRRQSRPGPARDLAAKGPCNRCNNGWMNDMDHGVLDVLGPQLIKGKTVKLTKAKKVALASWAVKYVLMCQLTHERDRRFAIPADDYTRFYDQRTPGNVMRLWAGYMEPPGKHGGSALAFTDFSLNETYHDPLVLERAGLDAALTSKNYCAIFRFGHCVISLYQAKPEILEVVRLLRPRTWVQIWPSVGTSEWPPAEWLPTGRVDPQFIGLPIRV
jgi:hypothetical protein